LVVDKTLILVARQKLSVLTDDKVNAWKINDRIWMQKIK